MRKLPKREVAPENGKSGVPRTVVPDDKYESIDWSTKGERNVTISYPNRLKENRCAMGELTGNKCEVCICNSGDSL